MQNPVFPDDFKVLYSEGASYWWWSPDTGPDFDGTVPINEDWPVGLTIGDADSASHELTVGTSFVVIWDVDGDETRSELSGVYSDDDDVNDLIRELMGTLSVHS